MPYVGVDTAGNLHVNSTARVHINGVDVVAELDEIRLIVQRLTDATAVPTAMPTAVPSRPPSTSIPTTAGPTLSPTTSAPTRSPTTAPTAGPTSSPSENCAADYEFEYGVLNSCPVRNGHVVRGLLFYAAGSFR